MSKLVGNLRRELESMYKSLDKLPVLKEYDNFYHVKPSRNIKAKIRRVLNFDIIQVFVIKNKSGAGDWHQDKFWAPVTAVVCSYPQSTEFTDRIYFPGDIIQFDDDEFHRSSDHYPRIVIRAAKEKPKLDWEDRSSDLYD